MEVISYLSLLLGYIFLFGENFCNPIFEDSGTKMLELVAKYPQIFCSKSIFLMQYSMEYNPEHYKYKCDITILIASPNHIL